MSSKTAVLWDVFLMCVYAGIAVLFVVAYLRGAHCAIGVIVFGFGVFRQVMFIKHHDVPDDPEND
jgi:hypothetical protein